MDELIGIGLYTPAEAGRLVGMRSATIGRWLRGYRSGRRTQDALWHPEIDVSDGRLYLEFRDLMELRVARALVLAGVPTRRIRTAIDRARDLLGRRRPLSTERFRTDGREVFLQIIETDPEGDDREHLIGLVSRNYAFKTVIDPVLKTVEFDEAGDPRAWWPDGRRVPIVVDPTRAFGQPIDAVSSVPVASLAAAGRQAGVKAAARAFRVPEASVHRSITFQDTLDARRVA